MKSQTSLPMTNHHLGISTSSSHSLNSKTTALENHVPYPIITIIHLSAIITIFTSSENSLKKSQKRIRAKTVLRRSFDIPRRALSALGRYNELNEIACHLSPHYREFDFKKNLRRVVSF